MTDVNNVELAAAAAALITRSAEPFFSQDNSAEPMHHHDVESDL
jgi:hypothetical protein